MAPQQDFAVLEYLPLEIQGSLFAIPVARIAAIHRSLESGGASQPPGYVARLLILDLRALLFPGAPSAEAGSIVVIAVDQEYLGLKVDRILPFRRAAPSAQQPLPVVASHDQSLFDRVLIDDSQLIPVLDMDRIVGWLEGARAALSQQVSYDA